MRLANLAVLAIAVLCCTQHAAAQCNATAARQLSGFCNNLINKSLGNSNLPFKRGPEGSEYEDGKSKPMTTGKPNERTLSNQLGKDTQHLIDTEHDLNMLGTVFGQLITHDIGGNDFGTDLAIATFEDPNDPMCFFPTPTSPNRCGPGNPPINVSVTVSAGSIINGTFEVTNVETSFLDLSVIYGATNTLLSTVRQTRTSCELALQNYTVGSFQLNNGLPEDPDTDDQFRAGDNRVNENIALGAFQLLFMREHNRLCAELAPSIANAQDRFDAARKLNIAFFQHIVFTEYAPAELGPHVMEKIGDYAGYNASVDPTTLYVFSTSAFRFAHSALVPYGAKGGDNKTFTTGLVPNLGRTTDTDPSLQMIAAESGYEPFLRGMIDTRPLTVDLTYDDVLRESLTVGGGVDLWAIDVIRSRQNGVPNFARVKAAWRPDSPVYGAPGCPAEMEQSFAADPMECWLAATDGLNDTAVQLSQAYSKVKNVDAIVGMLAEARVAGTRLGETQSIIIADQFQRLRAGDRMWYEVDGFLSADQMAQVQNTTLAVLLKRNFNFPDTDVWQMPSNVFTQTRP